MASDSGNLKEAQRILVRLRLDMSMLHLRVERGILIVSGKFCYPYIVSELQSDVNYELLHEVNRQLRLLPEVKGVQYELKNWVHNADGGWTKRGSRQTM